MNVAAHGHCEICGTVVEEGKRWCSDECKGRYDEAQKLKKRQMLIMVAVIVGALLYVNLVRAGIL